MDFTIDFTILLIFLGTFCNTVRCNTDCSVREEAVMKTSFVNTKISNLSLWSNFTEGKTACASECGRSKNCVSFFYNTGSNLCTAHAVQFYSTEPVLPDEGSLYYTMLVGE